MLRYIGRRLLILIPILLAVIVIIFYYQIFCTPGSPAISILGGSATPEKLAEVEHEMGLDRPYFVQLGEYLWNIITKFDFGTSYSFKRPVMEVIGERIGVTCLLGFLSVIVTVIIGIPIGIIAAVKQNRPVDYIATTIAVVFGRTAFILVRLNVDFTVFGQFEGAPDFRTGDSGALDTACFYSCCVSAGEYCPYDSFFYAGSDPARLCKNCPG